MAILKSTIEVERKFVPTAILRNQLNTMSKSDCAPFKLSYPPGPMWSYKKLGIMQKPTKRVRDTYLDFNGGLVRKDIWLRRRSEEFVAPQSHGKFAQHETAEQEYEWEAKVRLGGNYTDSQFEEVVGKEAVVDVLAKIAPGLHLDELAPFADLITERECWSVENYSFGNMSIVIDSVTGAKVAGSDTPTFGHSVGEVELTAEVVGGTDEAKHEGRKKLQAEGLRVRLAEFLERNIELFPDQTEDGRQVMGKLSAYLAWKEKMLQ